MERDLDNLKRDPFALSALAPAADLCAQVGDATDARLLYGAILPYEHHHGNVSIGISTHGPMARHLGMLAMRMGDRSAPSATCSTRSPSASASPPPARARFGFGSKP